MKRQFHSSSSLLNSQTATELESIPKRPRMFISLSTSSLDDDDDSNNNNNNNNIMDDNEGEEIIIDDLLVHSVTTTENSQDQYISDGENNDDDIIEIEQETSNLPAYDTDNPIIVVLDSDDNSDDQGIDVTDEILPLVTSIVNPSISSSDNEDIEIIQDDDEEELSLIDDIEEELEEEEEEEDDDDDDDDDDRESISIENNDNELIDLTDDEPTSLSCPSSLTERKLSTDVQQCPICLETLTHLQRTGVYLIITRCRHVMCTLCSRQLLATSSRCPLCRENVSSTTLMPYCILT